MVTDATRVSFSLNYKRFTPNVNRVNSAISIDLTGGGHIFRFGQHTHGHPRVANRAAMNPILAEIFAQRTTKEWVADLEKAGVPCGPINTIKDVFDHPHVKARGTRLELEHPTGGKAPLVASPMKFSGTPIEYKPAPPLLGQHTDDILGRLLGKSSDDIARLKKDGIV